MSPAPPDEPVPRLPRGKLLRVSRADLFRIGMFATLLVAVIFMRRPCAEGVASFVGSYQIDGGPGPNRPGKAIRYEHLTDEQIRQRFPSGTEDAGPKR